MQSAEALGKICHSLRLNKNFIKFLKDRGRTFKTCWESYTEILDQYISSFAQELFNNIKKRFPKCGTDITTNSVSHLLDLQFKVSCLFQNIVEMNDKVYTLEYP